jgi:Spy/CpxP family protein refolding chaperone
MKRKLIAAAAVAALFSAVAWAQVGPGMMGGYGPDGGFGPGYGMGPWMMGGHGPRGYGMGPGMMWGYGAGGYGGLKLSDEQRTKIASIEEEFSRKQWELMGKMHEQRYQLYGFDSSDKADESAARKAYQAVSDTRKAMFENSLDMRKRIDAVLTKEQREQLRSYWSRG